MTEEEARALTDEVRRDAATLWGKILRLYEGRAHLTLGYSSWAAYAKVEFGHSKAHAYRLLKAARIADELSLHVETRGMTEAQARWLTHVSPERRRVIVRAVAQRGGWEHISAAEVQALSLGELTGTIRTRGEKPFLVELRRLVNSINRSDRERIVSEIRDAPDLTLTLGRLKELRDFLAQVEAAATAAEGLNDAR